jgi:hypothetical protein
MLNIVWRNARLGLKSLRLTNLLTELAEMPPKYWQASFNFRAP